MSAIQEFVRALPHDPDCARRWTRAHNHGVSENDFGVMSKAISSWDCFRASVTWTDNHEPIFEADHDFAGAERGHAEFARDFEVTGIQMLNEFHSPWYQFGMESFAWRRRVDGAEGATQSAYFKPSWIDGITGLAFTQRSTWTREESSEAAIVRLSKQLDRFESAWRTGDIDAKLSTVGQDTRSAIGTAEVPSGRRARSQAVTKDELATVWSQSERVVEIERLHHFIDDWIVFAGYRMVVEGAHGRIRRETACLLPVGPDGLFVGELSYSLDLPAEP